MIRFEFGVSQIHSTSEILVLDGLSDSLCQVDGIHKRGPLEFILSDADYVRWSIGSSFQDGADSLYTLHGGQPTVIVASRAATLGVSKNGGPSVKVETRGKNILDGFRGDSVKM